MNIFQDNLRSLQKSLSEVDAAQLRAVNHCVEQTVQVLKNGGRIFLFGNGGSAATASHLTNDMLCHMKNWKRRGYPIFCLNDSAAAITSLSNDYGPDEIFAKQLLALGRSGDLVWAFSTSGNSKNVVQAVKAARNVGISTIAFTGKGGGQLASLCDLCIQVPATEVMRVEELHVIYAHCIGETVEAIISPLEDNE